MYQLKIEVRYLLHVNQRQLIQPLYTYCPIHCHANLSVFITIFRLSQGRPSASTRLANNSGLMWTGKGVCTLHRFWWFASVTLPCASSSSHHYNQPNLDGDPCTSPTCSSECSARQPPLSCLPHCTIRCIEFNTERFPSKLGVGGGSNQRENCQRSDVGNKWTWNPAGFPPPPADWRALTCHFEQKKKN